MRNSVPPPDYVEFVAGHADRLHAAARTLTGTDQGADDLVGELFAAAAARWSALRPPAASDWTAAEDYVGGLFRRAAAGYGPPRRRPAAAVGVDGHAIAAAAWIGGRRTRHRRVLAGAGAIALVVAVVLIRPGGPAPGAASDAAAIPEPTAISPTEVPAGIDLLPDPAGQDRLPGLTTTLPTRITLSDPVGSLRSHPIRRALAALRAPGSPLLLLGEDGRLRRAPDPPGIAPASTGAPGYTGSVAPPIRLTTTGLSPDGTRVAQPTTDGLSVLDVRTGAIRAYPSPERVRSVVWLSRDLLLLGRITASVLLDVPSGETHPAATSGRTMLAARAGADTPGPPRAVAAAVPEPAGSLLLPRDASPAPTPRPASHSLPGAMELLPVGEPATAPARLRRHVDTPSGVRAVDTAVSGELAGWIGSWRSAGFLTPRWALRDFTPVGQLPAQYPRPALATAAVDPDTGVVRRLLVTAGEDTESPQLIGMLNPTIALIRARGHAGTLNILAWWVTTGRLYRVTTAEAMAAVSVADLQLLT